MIRLVTNRGAGTDSAFHSTEYAWLINLMNGEGKVETRGLLKGSKG